jgi:phosphoglycerol transferase MdoB-like AlkP superfamily enzyme
MKKKILLTILTGAIIFMFSTQISAGKHDKTLTLENITKNVDQLIRNQSIMSWNNTTKGTPVDFE